MGAIERVFRGRRGGQERPAAAIVAGLWRNGEQGVWYDPSDLSTMFQDVAGGVPVYMPGQGQPDCWVGLQLDKRFGLARGPERLTNGDFSAGGASWITLNTDATHVTTFSGGTLRFQADTLSPALQVQQTGAMTVGRWYEIVVVVSAYTGGSLKTDALQAAGSGFVIANGLGAYRTIGISTSAVFSFTRGAVNTDITIDSISVRELPGNHRWQGTATSRPVLSARYNLLTRSEEMTHAVWLRRAGGSGSAPVITENYAVSPRGDLTADRVVISRGAGTAASDYSLLGTSVSSFSAATRTVRSVWLKSNTGGSQSVALYDGAQSVGGAVTVTPAWQQFFVYGGTAATSSSLDVGSRGGGTWFSNSQPDIDICMWGADIRQESDGVGLPSYQRVVDASTYDTAGFPLYRKPDGVDDWMQTASVDFTGTDKVTLAMALRKQSDALAGIAVELSADSNANVGTFALFAPLSAGAGTIDARSKGTVASLDSSPAVYPAPASVVAVMQASIPNDLLALRFNGVANTPVSSDQGTGTYGNHPIYFDRRGGANTTFGGRDYGTLIVGRLLTGPETAAVEKYLRQKSRAY